MRRQASVHDNARRAETRVYDRHINYVGWISYTPKDPGGIFDPHPVPESHLVQTLTAILLRYLANI